MPPLTSTNFVDTANSLSCNASGSSRSIFGILWTCLTVLFTCTWVAVHPNIPGSNQNRSKWSSRKKRMGFMGLTLITPEATLWIAVRQWLAARALVKRYRNKGWTMTHAHFALMGGFTVRLPQDDELVSVLPLLSQPIDPNIYRHNNFPEDFDIVKHIGDIDEDEIEDRSHSDAYAKIIALVQTSWLIIVLIARWVERLPFTELEVMAVAFATINIMTYIFWFKKPLEVQYPMLVRPDNCIVKKKPSEPFIPLSPLSPLSPLTPSSIHLSDDSSIHLSEFTDSDSDSDLNLKNGGSEPAEGLITDVAAISASPEPVECIRTPSAGEPVHRRPRTGVLGALLNQWKAIFGAEFSETHPLLSFVFFPLFFIFLPIQVIFTYFLGLTRFEDASSEEVLHEYKTGEDKLEKLEHLLKGSNFKYRIYQISISLPCGIAAIFGLIHWIAWLSPFPTRAEEMMWRISSIVVTFIPIHVELAYKAYTEREAILLKGPNVLKYIFASVWYIGSLVYILARCILIVQAFLTLRDLPCGVLQDIQWPNYLPHVL
ncbi:hypothetical protein C8R42DRAFT_634149 [Lentinula raphanica]|nr:hypothetical protein C8R42DRAFT_634149 [Lentinula raphanica]